MPFWVKEFRMSFIWVEAFPSLIPSGAPMGFLADPVGYEKAFLQAKSGSSNLKLPWPTAPGQHFWEYYLEKTALDHVTGDMAWKHLVPLCPPSPGKVSRMPEPYYRVAIEGFLYPHASGVIATVVLRGNITPEEMVNAAVEIRHHRTFDLIRSSGLTTRVSLREMATQTLDLLRTAVCGPRIPRQSLLSEPLTVVTIVEGSVDDISAENPQDGEVHRTLEGLCRLHPLWKTTPLHPLGEATCLRFKDREFMPKAHLLYGVERGRAVWFPGYFTPLKGEKIRKLGCYHRNLVMASLQTESLVSLARMVSSLIKDRAPIPAATERLARIAAGLLGRMHGGVRDKTYRSWSIRRQIGDHPHLGEINLVRDYFGMPKLTP